MKKECKQKKELKARHAGELVQFCLEPGFYTNNYISKDKVNHF